MTAQQQPDRRCLSQLRVVHGSLSVELRKVQRLRDAFGVVIDYLEERPGLVNDPLPRPQLLDLAEDVLRVQGPRHYRALYTDVALAGGLCNGQDPARTFAAHLSSDMRFQSQGNGVWDLSLRVVNRS